MTSTERFNHLYNLYLKGNISYREHDEFFDLISTGDFDGLLDENLKRRIEAPENFDVEGLPGHVDQELIRYILSKEQTEAEAQQKVYKIKRIKKWLVAASVLLISSVGFYYITIKNQYSSFVSDFVKTSSERKFNNTDHKVDIHLPDGSLITLQPHSSVYYSSKMFETKRDVYMEGEALFQVAKNPSRPFQVYYGQVVTKVLGTSFTIKTNKTSGNVEVEVLTGKVQVFENEKITHSDHKIMNFIVTPNQKAVYDNKKMFFQTTLTDHPVPIKVIDDEAALAVTAAKPVNFNFNHARLSEVFEKIEDSYGIEIVLSNRNSNPCFFSGNIKDLDLFNKLKIICVATNSTYEIDGTKILIKSSGCK